MQAASTTTTTTMVAEQQGPVDTSSPHAVVDAHQINRLGLHVIDDAVVTEEDAVIVPENNDLEGGVDTSQHDKSEEEEEEVAVNVKVIKSVNCCGREVRTSTIKWSICALLIVIVAIVVPTAVTVSGKDNIPRNEEPPSPPDTTLLNEKEMERLAKILALVTPLSSKEDLENPNSPQSKAVEWLLGPSNSRVAFENVTMIELGVSSETVVTERYAMATLYFSLGGEEWTKKWERANSDLVLFGPVRMWNPELIQTDEKGLVTGLFLGENNLKGTIPPEIQYLQRLQYFHIQKNAVSGTVPMEMETLDKLVGFWAQETNLTGSIDFFCDAVAQDDNNSTTMTPTTDNQCEDCGFQADLENVECSCCECCK